MFGARKGASSLNQIRKSFNNSKGRGESEEKILKSKAIPLNAYANKPLKRPLDNNNNESTSKPTNN